MLISNKRKCCIKRPVNCSSFISQPLTVYEMKTSLLILFASFAIALSAFNEFKADNEDLFIVVECKTGTKLDIAIVKSKYGLKALIQDNSSCQATSWQQMDNGQWGALTEKQAGRNNLPHLPTTPTTPTTYNLHYGETLTCTTFLVYVPYNNAINSSSLPFAECLLY